MADNTPTNAGSGGDTIASDDIGGIKFQRTKLIHGNDGVNDGDVSHDNPFPVALHGYVADYAPQYKADAAQGDSTDIMTDPDGNLMIRGSMLTDEGSYRVNFSNTSLAVSIGSCVFTNGSSVVTGVDFDTSDLRRYDYIKLDADAESAWAQVESLDSTTSITLVAAYTGTGGTGASSRAMLKPTTGSGGSIAVASGACTMTSGTTNAAATSISRTVDWLPLVKQAGVTVSQRIANQTTYISNQDVSATPKWFARFALDGTTNTTVKCQSARNPSDAPSAAETEETTVTLPGGATTASARRYRVEVLSDTCRFFVDGVLVARHFRSMPQPRDELTSVISIVNGTGAASSTTVTVDYDTCLNHNKLMVGALSDAEQVISAQVPVEMRSYSVAGVIAINTDLMILDCSQIRSISVHCSAMGTTGVVTPAWSNDGVNWVTATTHTENGATGTTFNAVGLRTTSVRARYFRLRLTTATTAGTTTLNVATFQQDLSPAIGTQPISGTVTATVTGGTTLPVTPTTAFTNSAATTNATSTKASAGTVWSIVVNNNNAAARYLKLYNKASAPTVGTDVPVIVIVIAPGTTYKLDGGSNGIRFATGIAWALTAGAADSDTAAVAALEHKVAISYT
jgi:hypothetical protein